MKIYLAGSISGKSYDDVVSRINNTKERLSICGYDCYSPMTAKEHLRNEVKFRAHSYNISPISTNHAIFERDKWMVLQCDIILVDLIECELPSFGSIMELAWGALENKYTIVIMEENNLHQHAFILEAADIIFNDRESAFIYLESLMK